MSSGIHAMQFWGEKLGQSYKYAARFAGEEGHIATLPEIISARAVSSVDHTIWTHFYTTASSEYFGLSAGGHPIVIVAHGNSPLANKSAITTAYSAHGDDKNGRRRNYFGRIPLNDFRKLENGHYGDVHIIDFRKIEHAYTEREHYNYLSVEAAAQDPLLQARLGQHWREVLEVLRERTFSEKLDDNIVNPPSVYSGGSDLFRKPPTDMPYANLLGVNQVINHALQGVGRFAAIEVKPHEHGNGVRFIGIRPGGSAASVHAGPEKLKYLSHKLLLPNEEHQAPAFFMVKQFDGQWFSCSRKEGAALDTHWAEFPATSVEVIGATAKLAVNRSHFFVYDMADVVYKAPKEANSYYLGEVRQVTSDDDVLLEADIYFCRTTLDTTMRCVSERELEDFDRQLQLIDMVNIS